MRPADRLFQIVLQLGRGRVLTAQTLAERLEVSERTIYRDIANLMASGIPIDGEAGVGYRLHRGYQVPPMMFDQDEIQALIFGAQVATRWGDHDMAAAAEHPTERIVWPLSLMYWGHTWMVGCWCELRQSFRSFRIDRIVEARILATQYPDESGKRRADYFAQVRDEKN